MDHNQERRRGHYRGRRGPDRRGPDRRFQPPQGQPRDQVDVEQIMRDIKVRIAQRQGVEFSTQQIQDLAARKLESILDPRAIKPSLLEAVRRGAGATGQPMSATAANEPVYTFEDTTIYDSHRGLMRLIRRLLNPILKLFFNPNPLIRALHLQAKLNVEAATREAERERRQHEWNALHYEIVQRLVTEISRLSLELQSLTMRVESLNARVDFTDRRVRSMEGTSATGRIPARPLDLPVAAAPAGVEAGLTPEPLTEGSPESARRRRRRRRGRRGVPGGGDAPALPQPGPSGNDAATHPASDTTAGGEAPAESALPSPESAVAPEMSAAPTREATPEPEPVPADGGQTDTSRPDHSEQ
jgi:hypothetical protein